MTQDTIRLGTRGSRLALVQSRWVQTQLSLAGHAVELVELKTEGDVRTGPLAQIGGQGLFTKRLQQALLDGEIDLAVHSLKDLPTEDHPELTVAAVPEREDTRDAFLSHQVDELMQLPQQATVGTGSVRRAAQLKYLRPDLTIRDIRGNVDTRLQKLADGEFDAIILACAGLRRMGLESEIKQAFPEQMVLPAVGQGALGLEIRGEDSRMREALQVLNHPGSHARVLAERSLLRTLFAGCLAPVGASTGLDGDQLQLVAAVLSVDGRQKIEVLDSGPADEAAALGTRVAEQLLANGAGPLLKEGRES